MNDEPKTLIEAVRHFSDLGVCFRYMTQMKWPDGEIVCPKCGVTINVKALHEMGITDLRLEVES